MHLLQQKLNYERVPKPPLADVFKSRPTPTAVVDKIFEQTIAHFHLSDGSLGESSQSAARSKAAVYY